MKGVSNLRLSGTTHCSHHCRHASRVIWEKCRLKVSFGLNLRVTAASRPSLGLPFSKSGVSQNDPVQKSRIKQRIGATCRTKTVWEVLPGRCSWACQKLGRPELPPQSKPIKSVPGRTPGPQHKVRTPGAYKGDLSCQEFWELLLLGMPSFFLFLASSDSIHRLSTSAVSLGSLEASVLTARNKSASLCKFGSSMTPSVLME